MHHRERSANTASRFCAGSCFWFYLIIWNGTWPCLIPLLNHKPLASFQQPATCYPQNRTLPSVRAEGKTDIKADASSSMIGLESGALFSQPWCFLPSVRLLFLLSSILSFIKPLGKRLIRVMKGGIRAFWLQTRIKSMLISKTTENTLTTMSSPLCWDVDEAKNTPQKQSFPPVQVICFLYYFFVTCRGLSCRNYYCSFI